MKSCKVRFCVFLLLLVTEQELHGYGYRYDKGKPGDEALGRAVHELGVHWEMFYCSFLGKFKWCLDQLPLLRPTTLII